MYSNISVFIYLFALHSNCIYHLPEIFLSVSGHLFLAVDVTFSAASPHILNVFFVLLSTWTYEPEKKKQG